MFIQTEQTPNPATLKFLPGREVLGSGTADFPDAASAGRSPLAERLFEVEGVTRVFLGSDFISISKADEAEWYLLKPQILGVIMEHFTAGRPVVTGAAEHDVLAGTAEHDVVTLAGDDEIFAGAGLNKVVAVAGADEVAPRVAEQRVIARRSQDDLVIGGAWKRCHSSYPPLLDLLDAEKPCPCTVE